MLHASPLQTTGPDLARNALAPPSQQRQAHEAPVIFYSCVIGALGPVILVGVPPIRKSLGYKPSEFIPTTYPRASTSVLAPLHRES